MPKKFILGNPPAGIYKGDLHIGYAFYHVVLDVYARYLREHEGFEVIGPRFSLNVFGKRGDKISQEENPEKFRKDVGQWVDDWISKNRLRDKLNLSLEGLLIDNSPKSVNESQKTFLQLYNTGYLKRDGETFFLDTEKIARERDLFNAAETIHFCPNRTKGEFTRMLVENTKKPIAITKPTRYSAINPLGGENLGPLFVLSTIWEAYYPEGINLLATSDKELARYILLRFLVRMATHRDPLTKGILTYNKIVPEGSFENWDVAELTEDPYKTDMLRYALIKSHSVTKQKTILQKSSLLSGRNFVYLVGNLRKFFSGQKYKMVSEGIYEEKRKTEEYRKKMKAFKFNEVLSELEIQLRDLSKRINASRDTGSLGENLPKFFEEYFFCLRQISPFCPAIENLAKKDLSIPNNL